MSKLQSMIEVLNNYSTEQRETIKDLQAELDRANNYIDFLETNLSIAIDNLQTRKEDSNG